MHQDSILVQEILAGNNEAFGDLVRKYYTLVYRQVEAMLRNQQDAQDVTQDVLVKALENLAFLQDYSSFEAWVGAIVRHECQNRFRRSKERQASVPSEELPDGNRGVEDDMVLSEALREVISAIDELSETEKQLLRKRYLEGVSYEDLQKSHRLSYKAVTMRIIRARQKVKQRVRDKIVPGLGLSADQEMLIATSLQATATSITPDRGGASMNHMLFDFKELLPARIKGKFGYINREGQTVIPAQFDRALGFCEGLTRVAVGDKHGYINTAGETVIPLKFDEAYPIPRGVSQRQNGG